MNQFQRTRRDHGQETAEDYVEMIQTLIDEVGQAKSVEMATRLGVSAVTINQTVKRLAREGYVIAQPYRSLLLTDKGRALAESARQRHEVVLSFLLHIGVEPISAEHDAEGMEHHASEETLSAMRRWLESQSK